MISVPPTNPRRTRGGRCNVTNFLEAAVPRARGAEGYCPSYPGSDPVRGLRLEAVAGRDLGPAHNARPGAKATTARSREVMHM